MRSTSTIIFTLLIIIGYLQTCECLDVEAFYRIFNKTSLTTEQMNGMAELYNNQLKTGTARKAVLDYISNLSNTTRASKLKLKKKFKSMWADDLFLRKLYNESMDNIKNLISSDLKTKISSRKISDDKLYKGDFAKIQLDLVRFIKNEVPKENQTTIVEKLNKPLQRFTNATQKKKLISAIATFQVPEASTTTTIAPTPAH